MCLHPERQKNIYFHLLGPRLKLCCLPSAWLMILCATLLARSMLQHAELSLVWLLFPSFYFYFSLSSFLFLGGFTLFFFFFLVMWRKLMKVFEIKMTLGSCVFFKKKNPLLPVVLLWSVDVLLLTGTRAASLTGEREWYWPSWEEGEWSPWQLDCLRQWEGGAWFERRGNGCYQWEGDCR